MPVVYEDYSPITVGDTGTPLAPVFQSIDPLTGKPAPRDLSGLTISLVMVERESGQVKVCSGPWVIDNAAQGQAHYSYQDSDVDTPGIWQLQWTLTDGQGKPVHSAVRLLEIKPPLGG